MKIQSAALAASLALASHASAVIITTADGNGGDTFVRDGAATENRGNDPAVTVKLSGSTGTNRVGFLKFDLAGLPFVPTGVTLQIGFQNIAANMGDPTTINFNVFGLNEANAEENFIEGNGGTDNNPAGEFTFNRSVTAGISETGGNTFNETSSTLLGSFGVTAADNGTTLQFTSVALTSFIASDTDGIATLILVAANASAGTNNFASKETTVSGLSAPALNIIPEPGSALLALGGGVGLLGLLRRRR